jgi:hypothetical protein
MNIEPTKQNRLCLLLDDLNNASNQYEKIILLENFHTDLHKEIQEKCYAELLDSSIHREEKFKEKSRTSLARWVPWWFFTVNICTFLAIAYIFYLECSNQFLLGKGVINTTVITALITATIVQNAAVFVVFAKYAFGFDLKPPAKKAFN